MGIPEVGGSSTITITAANPISSINQSHELRVFDPLAFSSRLELSVNPSALGEIPADLAGLSLHLDASTLPDQNGTFLSA